MECGLSYAVVLDSEGRFLKVPNLGYEVGQTLNNVVLQDAPPQPRPLRKYLARWAAMAACLCIMVIGSWNFWKSPVGTVRMQINPDVQINVNRFDRVVGLEGMNEDGETLIKGYRAYGKGMQAVSAELADRAVEQGYLSDGGQITLTVESDRASWKTATEELLLLELDVHFEHRIIVVTVSADEPEVTDETSKPVDTIVIQPEQLLPEQADDDNDDRYDADDQEDETSCDRSGDDDNDSVDVWNDDGDADDRYDADDWDEGEDASDDDDTSDDSGSDGTTSDSDSDDADDDDDDDDNDDDDADDNDADDNDDDDNDDDDNDDDDNDDDNDDDDDD